MRPASIERKYLAALLSSIKQKKKLQTGDFSEQGRDYITTYKMFNSFRIFIEFFNIQMMMKVFNVSNLDSLQVEMVACLKSDMENAKE